MSSNSNNICSKDLIPLTFGETLWWWKCTIKTIKKNLKSCFLSIPVSESYRFKRYTLQGINISHLGKRKIIFKMPFVGDMLVSWRVIYETVWHTNTLYVGIQNLRLRSSSSLRRLRIVIEALKEIAIPAKISYGSWTHRIHGTGILGY